MKLILILFLSIPAFGITANNRESGKRFARHYAKSLKTLQNLAEKTDDALDSMIRVGVKNMRDTDRRSDADQIEKEWNTKWHGSLQRSYDIGDHAPLIQWLADAYNKMEAALSVEVCKALHLSDIKTVNYALPVVFRPCSYPLTNTTESRKQDYRDHFARGRTYYGLVPVTTWWACSIGCWVGTSGFGAFVCGVASGGAEWLMGNVLAPKISDSIFNSLCPSSL